MTERERKHRRELQAIWDANGAAEYEKKKERIIRKETLKEKVLNFKEKLLNPPPPPPEPTLAKAQERMAKEKQIEQEQTLADWKEGDMGAANNITFSEQSMSQFDLVANFQQSQTGNTCTSYSIATAFNLLYGTNITGQDVVDTFTNSDLILPSFIRYSWGLFGGAVLPNQGERVINDLSELILEQSDNLPTAEAKNLITQEMIEILNDPNQVATFTFNTNNNGWIGAKWLSGHTVVLAMHDPQKGFGFLNSG
ncbi:MAG: hypothetical protein HN392_07050 [Anaerolineae bacterium]|jgi:hypothetical protein|nr:hypothetical protein [Anaerolineae bacterium]MBT7073952.1 hypothetical protein [Anaerolineae bacterium]MBT7782478.1 hypothetical protein [Anaerolineae bacterium]